MSLLSNPAYEAKVEAFAQLPREQRLSRIDAALPDFRKQVMKIFGNKQAAADDMAALALGNDRANCQELARLSKEALADGRFKEPEITAAIRRLTKDEDLTEQECLEQIWLQTFQSTPGFLSGMKSVDVIPRWITINQRLADFAASRLSTGVWDKASKDEMGDYFSDQLESATSTPPLQTMR